MRKALSIIVSVQLAILIVAFSALAFVNTTPQEVKQRMDNGEDLFIMDVRQPNEYATGYVPNAVLIPLGEVADRLDEIPKDKPVIVVCRSGARSAQASQILDDNGFEDVANVLGGTSAWQSVPYHLYITPEDLRNQLVDFGKFMVDVRTTDEYNALHIADAVSIPLDELEDRINEIPMNKKIIVIADGNDQGDQASEMLISAGYEDVKNMAGGMPNWEFETSVNSKGRILTTFGKIKAGK